MMSLGQGNAITIETAAYLNGVDGGMHRGSLKLLYNVIDPTNQVQLRIYKSKNERQIHLQAEHPVHLALSERFQKKN